jgi:hypothetical protein
MPHSRAARIWNSLCRAKHGNGAFSDEGCAGWSPAADLLHVHVSNITSIKTKLGPIATKGFDGLHLLTETKADKGTQIDLDLEMNDLNQANGYKSNIVWGEAIPDQTAGRNDKRGVAAFVGPRHHGHLQRLQGGGDSVQHWRSEGRLEGFKLLVRLPKRHATDSGECFIFIFVVYCPVNDPKMADQLLRDVFVWQKEVCRSSPVLIVGDFNLEVTESDVMQIWQSDGCFVDLNFQHSIRSGVLPAPTTMQRRVDHVWGNHLAGKHLVSCSYESVFATHSTISVTFDYESFSQMQHTRFKPRLLPRPLKN